MARTRPAALWEDEVCSSTVTGKQPWSRQKRAIGVQEEGKA